MSSIYTAAFNLIFPNIISYHLRFLINNNKFKWCQTVTRVSLLVLTVISMFTDKQITQLM